MGLGEIVCYLSGIKSGGARERPQLPPLSPVPRTVLAVYEGAFNRRVKSLLELEALDDDIPVSPLEDVRPSPTLATVASQATAPVWEGLLSFRVGTLVAL